MVRIMTGQVRTRWWLLVLLLLGGLCLIGIIEKLIGGWDYHP
jgi:hypothetical protein